MSKLKKKMSFKSFPLRSVISTIAGEFIFSTIATITLFKFGTSFNNHDIIILILSSATLKIIMAFTLSFPIYLFLKYFKKVSSYTKLRIKNIDKIGGVAGATTFTFQVIGTRAKFKSSSRELDINQFYSLNLNDKKLIESDLDGKILEILDEYFHLKKRSL